MRLLVVALVHVGEQAEDEIARLSGVEEILSARVPAAAGRLQAIGDITTVSVLSELHDLRGRLR